MQGFIPRIDFIHVARYIMQAVYSQLGVHLCPRVTEINKINRILSRQGSMSWCRHPLARTLWYPPSLITVTRGQYARNLGYFGPMLTERTPHLSNLLCLGADDGFSRSRCTHSSFVDGALGGKAFDAFHRCPYFSNTDTLSATTILVI